MRSELRLALVGMPPALLVLAALFDVADFIGGWPFFGDVAFVILAGGAVASGLAGLLGLADLFALPIRSRARRTATTYGLVHTWSVGLLALVWLARAGAEHHSVGAAMFLVELLGFAGVGTAYWHGSPLAWRFGQPSARDERTGTG